jgi:DNA-binding response OmpR family regulator
MTANTGAAAIDLALRYRPKAILLDVHLPDIGGVEVCRALRARPEFQSTPVILISALFRSPHDQLEGLNEGALLYLIEPIDREMLLTAVRRALG